MAKKIVTRIKNRAGAYVNVIDLGTKDEINQVEHTFNCTGCNSDGATYNRDGAMEAAQRHAASCAFEPAEG